MLAIDNQLNTDTGTIGIKAKFANTDNRLFPNQFVNVRLHLGSRPQAILVPTVAIQLGKLGHTVYRVNDNGTVSLVQVKTGPVSGENTIIEEGLEPGQIVVTDGVDKLRDGSKIRIIRPKTADTNEPAASPEAARKDGKAPETAAPDKTAAPQDASATGQAASTPSVAAGNDGRQDGKASGNAAPAPSGDSAKK